MADIFIGKPGVIARVNAEFEAESVVVVDKLDKVIETVGIDVRVYDVDVVLNASQITYVSWTLSTVIREWVEGFVYKGAGGKVYTYDDVCKEGLKTNNARKSDYVLRCAIKAFLGRLPPDADTVTIWTEIYLLGQAYQRAVYGWDKKTKRFGVEVESNIYRAHPHFDQSFLREINLLVKGNELYANFEGGPVAAENAINKIKVDIGWGQVETLKIANAKAALKVGTGKIMMPEQISEVTFRMMVREMTDTVFGDGKWSDVEIKPDEKERLNSALCLLMLGIGSRARGIIMVNEIEALNYDVIESVKDDKEGLDADEKEKDEGLVELRHQLTARTIGIGTMRVKRLTKEKDDAVLAGSVMRYSKEYKGKTLSEAEAKKIVDSDKTGRMIDKPFLYMFFSQNGAGGGEAQLTFIQLLKTVRDCMKALSEEWCRDSWGGEVKWEQYETLGRKIWVLARAQPFTKPKEMFMRKAKKGMQTACVQYISDWLPHLTSHTPHESRRMYVCYAFEYYGRTISKEIAFAQYVLRHTSISSSMRYTTLNFVMAISDGMSKDKKFKSAFVDKMTELDEMKGKVVELQEAIEMGLVGGGGGFEFNVRGKKKRKMTVMFRDKDGDVVTFRKMKRAKRGTPRDVMVARAKEQVDYMRMGRIPLTRVNVTKAGVNTNIIEEVMRSVVVDRGL